MPISTGVDRIDNPDVHDALYLGDRATCTVGHPAFVEAAAELLRIIE